MSKKKIKSEKSCLPEKDKSVQTSAQFNLESLIYPSESASDKISKMAGKCPIEFYHSPDEKTGEKCHNVGLYTEKGNTSSLENQFASTLTKLMGVTDPGLAVKLYLTAVNAMTGSNDEAKNVIIQALNNNKPKNSIEAALYTQIIVLHTQAMTYLRRAENADMIHWKETALNAANKLFRLQHEAIDTLVRLQRGGEQKVVVQHQHVNVSDGGQAVVGHFQTGGGVQQKTEEPHE